MAAIPPDNTTLYRTVDAYQRTMALYDRMLAQITVPFTTHYVEYEAAFDRDAAIRRARQRLPHLVHSAIIPGVGHGPARIPRW